MIYLRLLIFAVAAVFVFNIEPPRVLVDALEPVRYQPKYGDLEDVLAPERPVVTPLDQKTGCWIMPEGFDEDAHWRKNENLLELGEWMHRAKTVPRRFLSSWPR